jgi:hypothetical protein
MNPRTYTLTYLAVWRIGDAFASLAVSGIDDEKRLEDLLADDISIASPYWMVIGRQVATGYGTYVDLLAIDGAGKLIVLELKKNRTPREVVAQVLDYGSWVRELEDNDIAGIYGAYVEKHRPGDAGRSLDEAFCERFSLSEMPEVLNDGHELVVVASALDDSTERIVSYLADEYGVAVNAIFFRVFKDGDREYLTRAWLIDPVLAGEKTEKRSAKEPWNGEYYVSFGHDERRQWEDARKYGFLSAGGGRWYSRTLDLLEPGARVWVNVPKHGYVGVGTVQEPAMRVGDFHFFAENGGKVPIAKATLVGKGILDDMDDDDKCERLVRVKWEKTVGVNEAISEKGFFGNQNSVCKPRAKKWRHTVERLKERFGIV